MVVDCEKNTGSYSFFPPTKLVDMPGYTSGYAWIETGYAWMVVDCALFSGFCHLKIAKKPTFSLFLVTVKKYTCKLDN